MAQAEHTVSALCQAQQAGGRGLGQRLPRGGFVSDFPRHQGCRPGLQAPAFRTALPRPAQKSPVMASH